MTQVDRSSTQTWSREGLIKVALAVLGVILLTSFFFLAVDRYFSEWEPDGEIVVLALGYLLLSRYFSQRDRYRKKYGKAAYETAFWRLAMPGLGIVGASFAHLAYIFGPEIPDIWWRPWLIGIGWFLVAAGILLLARTLQVAGIDTLLMRYVYQSSAGRRADSGLYELLRHPLYSAAMHITFGLAFIHANWYALLVAILIPIFLFGWIRLVEEPELLQRFPGYAEYRKRVPAFLPWPRDEIKLWRFLLGI